MIAWLTEAVIASSALMLAVMALRGPVARHFGAQAAYALWALPALRMVLPPMAPAFGAAAPMAAVQPVSGTISDIVRDSVLMESAPVAAVASPATVSWIALAVLLWLAGAGLFLVGHLWGYRRFRAHMLAGSRALGDAAPGIGLVASPRASGPMAFGLVRKLIVFPVDAAARFDSDEHALALAHELAHHKRGDLIANAFALVVAALHWWNPVAWIAYRMFRADQEVACDAQVVAEARRRGLGQVYGRALIKAATNREYAIACHLTSVETLKRRLNMLAQVAPSRRRRAVGLALIGGTTLGGLALTASAEGVAADMGSRVAAALPAAGHLVAPTPLVALIGGAVSAAPTVPAPPAEPAGLIGMEAPAAPDAPDAPISPEAPRHAVPPVPPMPPAPPAYYVDLPDMGIIDAEVRGAMRNVDEAVREAQSARREALREADQARREAEQDRREAEQDRRAALQDAEQARREAMRESEEVRRQAMREGEQARRDAMKAGLAARAEAMRAGQAARAQALAGAYRASIVASAPRVHVTQTCSPGQSQGVHQVSRVDDDGQQMISIAVCGEAIERQARAQAIAGLTQARASIASNTALSEEARAAVSRDFDREIARLRAKRD